MDPFPDSVSVEFTVNNYLNKGKTWKKNETLRVVAKYHSPKTGKPKAVY